MDWLTEPLSLAFMQKALLASVLAVVATALVGTWVVLRGMAFMGDALAHGVLPGITIAYLNDLSLGFGGFVSALAMIGAVVLVGRRSRLSSDTSIGLLFVGMLALGVVIISKRGAYAGDLLSFLFGDPLGVTSSDVRVAAVVAVLAILVTVLLYRPFIVLTFSRDKAHVLGLRPGLMHLLMLALMALAIVTAFQTVGTLLVFAFMIAPPATASLLARRVPVMMVLAVVIGALGVVIGLLVSYHAETAAAATVAGVTVLEFFLVLMGREVVDGVRAARARQTA